MWTEGSPAPRRLPGCGPDTNTGISLAGDADGAIVVQITRTRVVQTPTYSLATGWIRVISIDPPPLSRQP